MENFLVYGEQWPAISLLSDEERGRLFQALFTLHGACDMPELSVTAQAIFLLMRPRMNENRMRYEERCEQNRINGRKGGRGRKAENRKTDVETDVETEKSERFSESHDAESMESASFGKDEGGNMARERRIIDAETGPETVFLAEKTEKSDRFCGKTQKTDRFLSPNGGEADQAQQPDRSLVSGSGYNIINNNINKKEKIHPPLPPQCQREQRQERQGVGGEGMFFPEQETPSRRAQENGQPLPITQRTETPFAEDPDTRGDMGFQQLVDAYPVGHVGSLEEARRVWERMRQRRELPGLPRLLGGVAIWQDSDQWNRDGGRYIKRLANFLRDRMWEVAPPAPEKLIPDDWEERAARERKAEIARGVRILEAYERQKQRREAVQLAMAQ